MTPEIKIKELETTIEFLENELKKYRIISAPENNKEITETIKCGIVKFAARIKFCENISDFDKTVNTATDDILELIRSFTKSKI